MNINSKSDKTFAVQTLPRMLLCFCCAVLFAAMLTDLLPTAGEETISDRFIRLHVLANSDSEDDQALKLRVRDAVIDCIASRGGNNVGNVSEAEALFRASLPEIEAAAESVIADAGYDYPCTAVLTKESYPARTYGDVTLPAGTYRSLRVLIGEAEGHNWWCVLFPPLCLSLASEYRETAEIPSDAEEKAVQAAETAFPDPNTLLRSAGFTPYEVSLLSEKSACTRTIVKFRIVEFLRNLFSEK